MSISKETYSHMWFSSVCGGGGGVTPLDLPMPYVNFSHDPDSNSDTDTVFLIERLNFFEFKLNFKKSADDHKLQ